MGCFSFSHSERRKRSSSNFKISWPFSSQGSAAVSKTSTSQTKSQATTEDSLAFSSGSSSVNSSQISSQRPPNLRIFSYEELRAATGNFSAVNWLGEGGFGPVYKGLIKHQNPFRAEIKEVAIKELNNKGQQGHKEWLAEVHFLGLVEHPNLVKLVGYCAEDGERGIQRLLVYEYMVNRSLEDHLFRNREQRVLPWQQRLCILLGTASGLAYLHEEVNDIQVIFRDLKPSNILLDKDFTPKLSDFGLARKGPEMGATHVSTAVVGTLGYAAPEYIQTGRLTVKSDVWSFGMVVLEMLSGRRALDQNLPKNEQHLLDWMKPYLHGNRNLDKVMDPRLEGQYSLLQAQKIASLAHQCLVRNAKTRPSMSVIVGKLREFIKLHDTGSQQSVTASTSLKSGQKYITNAYLKESESEKRRRLAVKDVMNLGSKEDAQLMWRGWGSKGGQL